MWLINIPEYLFHILVIGQNFMDIKNNNIMKINFTQFPIYDGIKKERLIAHNISESLANGIYINIPGLKAHLLAEKIYKSVEEMDLDNEEIKIIIESAEMFPGVLADSIKDYLNKEETEENHVD